MVLKEKKKKKRKKKRHDLYYKRLDPNDRKKEATSVL